MLLVLMLEFIGGLFIVLHTVSRTLTRKKHH